MNEVHQGKGGAPLIDPFNRAGKPAKDSYVASIIAFAVPGRHDASTMGMAIQPDD